MNENVCQMARNGRPFACDNGKTYIAKENCCLFCDHCTDIFYDFNGPYMMLCTLELDTEMGMAGKCPDFLEECEK